MGLSESVIRQSYKGYVGDSWIEKLVQKNVCLEVINFIAYLYFWIQLLNENQIVILGIFLLPVFTIMFIIQRSLLIKKIIKALKNNNGHIKEEKIELRSTFQIIKEKVIMFHFVSTICCSVLLLCNLVSQELISYLLLDIYSIVFMGIISGVFLLIALTIYIFKRLLAQKS